MRADSFRRVLTIGLGAQLLAGPVLLAQSASSAPAADASKMEKRVVVGSNIPTAEVETAQPVEIFTREKIDQMGVTTVTDLLLRVPQSNQGALNGNNGGTGFAAGGTGVSLRGLGLNATLILLNGRRVAPYGFSNSGTDSFVDLNSLPLEAIEQVEILTSGASAVYGADAIAGVINIKTKKDYHGGELRFYYGNTVHQDYATTKGSITFGTGNDKTDLLIVADYLHQNDLYNRDRAFSSEVDLRPLGGINNGSSFPYPGRFTVPKTAPGLAGTPFAGASGTVTLVPPLGTDGKAAPGSYHPFGDSDRFNFLQRSQSLPRSQREGVYGNFNHKIFDEKMEAFGEFMFRHGEEHVELAPAPIDLAGSGSGIGIPVGTSVVKKGVVNVGNQVTIPKTNPFNPFGVDISAGRLRLLETGNRLYDFNTDSFRMLGGLRGELSEKFSYETAVMYNRAQTVKNGVGVGVQQFQNALNDPNPLTAFNPFSGPSAPNNPATVSGLLVGSKQVGTTDVLSWDAKGFGSLFDLPGGTVGYAVGLEYRTEKFTDDPDQVQRAGGLVGQSPALGNAGSRNLTAAYIESRIPITGKDWNILGFYRVDVTAAGRVDSYSDFGDSEVPSVGIEWRPFSEDFLLRSSYGESFRPASLQQLYNSASDALTSSFRDPLRGTVEREIPISRGGNTNLRPETATEWTAGAVLSPAAAKGLRISVDWVQIARKNEIGSYADFFGNGALSQRAGSYTRLPYEGDAAFLAANPGAALPKADPLTGLPAGQIFTLNDQFQNLGSTIMDAVDFGISYELKTDTAGTWRFDLASSYLLSYRTSAGPGEAYEANDGFATGSDAFPKWRSTASLFWNYRKLEAGVVANYVGEVAYSNPATGDDATVSSFMTFDVQASYKLPWDVKVTAGINNILDSNPPLYLGFSNNSFAYLSSVHNPLGRQYYFQLSKKF